MSTLETNNISKYNGNNVSMGDSLKLKSYTTTQRDALTSVAGDTIYNSTVNKVQYYNGSAWEDTGSDFFELEYTVVGGGGSGSGAQTHYIYSGGGGGGGVLTNLSGATAGGGGTLNPGLALKKDGSTTYRITVGAGGAGAAGNRAGNSGSDSEFGGYLAFGGGQGGGYSGGAESGGSGGGAFHGQTGAAGTANQGYAGGTGSYSGNTTA